MRIRLALEHVRGMQEALDEDDVTIGSDLRDAVNAPLTKEMARLQALIIEALLPLVDLPEDAP